MNDLWRARQVETGRNFAVRNDDIIRTGIDERFREQTNAAGPDAKVDSVTEPRGDAEGAGGRWLISTVRNEKIMTRGSSEWPARRRRAPGR